MTVEENMRREGAKREGMFQDKDMVRVDVSTDRTDEAMLSEKTPGDSVTINSDEGTDRGPILLNGEKYVGWSVGIEECKKDPLVKKEARVIVAKETVTDDYYEAVQGEPLCQEQESENMEETDKITSLKEESFELLVDNYIEADEGEDLCHQPMEENEDWSSMEISFSSGESLDDSTTGARHW